MSDISEPGSATTEPTVGKKRTPRVKKATNGETNTEEKKTVSRPRLPKYPDDHIITVLKPGSKAGNAKDRFNQYQTGMSVKSYVDIMSAEPWNRSASLTYADMRWDSDEKRSFINIGPSVVDIPPPPPPKEKKPRKAKAAEDASPEQAA